MTPDAQLDASIEIKVTIRSFPNFRTLSVDHQLIGTELMLILVCGHYKWTAGLLILRSGSFTPKVW